MLNMQVHHDYELLTISLQTTAPALLSLPPLLNHTAHLIILERFLKLTMLSTYLTDHAQYSYI